MADQPTKFFIRKTHNDRLALFIHGFSGDAHVTFGMMPAFVAGDPRLFDWDLASVGYPTGLAPDFTGIWAADPDIQDLASYLAALIVDFDFKDYPKVSGG